MCRQLGPFALTSIIRGLLLAACARFTGAGRVSLGMCMGTAGAGAGLARTPTVCHRRVRLAMVWGRRDSDLIHQRAELLVVVYIQNFTPTVT